LKETISSARGVVHMRLAKGPHGPGWIFPRSKVEQTLEENEPVLSAKIQVASPRLDVPSRLLIVNSPLTVATPSPLISYPELCIASVVQTGAMPETPTIKPVLVRCGSARFASAPARASCSAGSFRIFVSLSFTLLFCLVLVGLFTGLERGPFWSLFVKVAAFALLSAMLGYGLFYGRASSRPEKTPPLELESSASTTMRGETFLERTSSPPV